MIGAGKDDDWDEAYARTTGRTIDEEIEAIERDAGRFIGALSVGFEPMKRNEMARWSVKQLGLCGSFRRPPPPKLVELVARLLGVGTPPRGRRRNRKKRNEAAQYLAERPNATVTAIARAIGRDQKRLIKTWLQDPEFQPAVERERSQLRRR